MLKCNTCRQTDHVLSRAGLGILCYQVVIADVSGQSLLRFMPMSSQKVAVVSDSMQLMLSSATAFMVNGSQLVCGKRSLRKSLTGNK